MITTKSILLFAWICGAGSVMAQHGEEYSETMGPVAFMWPPDRVWGAAQDNTAPCGSAAGVTNRTQFPLLNGAIALVAQDESWSIQVSISHSNNPSSNADFETIIEGHRIPDIDEGHECYPIPNPSADVEAGANATLQIRYTSEFDTNENETYYACADIVYVPTSQFTYQVPCFNATVDDFEIVETNGTASASGSAAGASSTGEAPSTSKSSSSGLSGGAIAGIVVGVVVGLIAVVGGLFFMWRHTQQKKRLRQQEASLRTVKWDEHSHGGSASQTSDRDIALGNLR